MLILELLAIIGISAISFTDNPVKDCGYYTDSCYQNNKIILSYYSPNIDKSFYYELGRRLFDSDGIAQELTEGCLSLRNHLAISVDYEEYSRQKVADYFSEYNLHDKEFSVKYPSLYIYFRDRTNKILERVK